MHGTMRKRLRATRRRCATFPEPVRRPGQPGVGSLSGKADRIDALDLEVVRKKLTMPADLGGYAWPEDETDVAIREK